MDNNRIKELVAQMTLEEKAGITSGENAWFTKAIERLGIPAVHVSDGPHGMRTIEGDQSSMEGRSIPAVAFPAECAMAASFDKALLYEEGQVLGREAKAFGVDVLLGPGVNMKRSPLCGRNFEYFSEDPYLAGEMGVAYVNGVQSENVGTSLKHFFANNQEFRRNDSSSNIDERTMREIYLPAFEAVVKKAYPWTVMASYNKVNGTFSTENEALEKILRDDWGFEGIVVSDWGATHNRGKAILAGTDLTMPGEDNDIDLVNAVKEGKVSEEALDKCVERMLTFVFKCVEARDENASIQDFDYENDHAFVRRAAGESMVLLKNKGALPIAKDAEVAFIGEFAKKPRFQGGGSSNINASKVVAALDAAKENGYHVVFAQGYDEQGNTNEELLAEAVKCASEVDTVVIFAGLHDDMETEGSDRAHMRMSDGHNTLIQKVCSVNKKTAVVLHNGSPVEMPWVAMPNAILEAYLGGQAVGEATVDILFGDVNPSGHLAESFPKQLSDNPSYLSFKGEGNQVNYQEGIFVGYRYYTTKKMETLFSFGHGLSYTTFEYSKLVLDKNTMTENDTVTATVTVSNTGSVKGKAVVQLYVAPHKVEIIRPVRELKGFEKIELAPGESKEVSFVLDSRAFAHWNIEAHAFKCERGGYDVQICENAASVLLSETIEMDVEPLLPIGGFCEGIPMKMIAATEEGHAFLNENLVYMVRGMIAAGFIPEQLVAVVDNIPGGLTLEAMEMLSQRAGSLQRGAGGVSGLDALLMQPLAILKQFIPRENRIKMEELIEKLNKQAH